MKKRNTLFILVSTVLFVLSSCMSVSSDSVGGEKETKKDTFHYEQTIPWDCTYDVVVIGFGGSGALASSTACDAGAKVLLVEKAPEGGEGGNTKVCSQHVLSFADYDSGLAYMKACRDGFDLILDDEYLENYVKESITFEKWWRGLGFTEYKTVHKADFPEFPGSDSVIVYYTETGSQRFWPMLRQMVFDRDIDVWFNSPAIHLLQDPYSKTVLGVQVKTEGRTVNVRAKNGVVMACGGFENSKEMMQNYAGLNIIPQEGYNTGDGINMGIEVGAQLWHTGQVSGPFPCFVDPQTGTNLFWIHYKLTNQGKASIIVGPDGTRFYDESTYVRHGDADYHGSLRKVIYPEYSYVIFDSTTMDHELYGGWGENNKVAIDKGYIVKGDTINELAEKINVDPKGLAATIEEWNGYCGVGRDSRFGRKNDLVKFTSKGPYYALKCTPSCYNTSGGPVRNLKCEVLDTKGNVIPHLYSCGDLGDYAVGHYQAGFSLCNVYWTGRVAGKSAASVKTPLEPTTLTMVSSPDDFVKSSPKKEKIKLEANQYVGEGTGMGGPLRVKVTYEDGKIEKIEMLLQNETPEIGGKALPLLVEKVLKANSVDIDVVTGATVTSNAFKAAVKSAIKTAKKQ